VSEGVGLEPAGASAEGGVVADCGDAVSGAVCAGVAASATEIPVEPSRCQSPSGMMVMSPPIAFVCARCCGCPTGRVTSKWPGVIAADAGLATEADEAGCVSGVNASAEAPGMGVPRNGWTESPIDGSASAGVAGRVVTASTILTAAAVTAIERVKRVRWIGRR
jgi:hypothetical protein